MLGTLLALALLTPVAQPAERIVDVRVQGNTLTADSDVVRLAGVTPGTEVTPSLLADVQARLKATGHFERVEVLKRYASIEDLSQILLVIVVDEGRVVIKPMKDGQPARAVRKRGPPLMLLPMFGSEEGYGFTYGALVALPNVAGRGTRLSLPLTWGGERRAGAELEKRFDSPRLTRVTFGSSILRRENDALDAVDRREQVWLRGQREVIRSVRIGAWTGFDHVSFGGEESRVTRLGVDATLDTRVDPLLSRNALFVRTAAERLDVRDGSAPLRTLVDASGYLGGPGPSTIVVRIYRDGSNIAVPGYLKVLRGRDSTLRGFRAGTAAGDTTAAGTIEVRWPVTNPLSVGKLGLRAFVDAATVYDAGASIRDQHFDRGAGGGVFLTATVIRFSLDVARGSNGATRVQLSSGLLF